MGLMDILGMVVSGGRVSDTHFDQMVNSVPPDVMAKGIGEAFRSDQTPAIGDMVGQLFGNSSGAQQAGMLNQIMAALGPAVAGALAGGALARVLAPGAQTITAEQAAQLSPQQVQQVVDQAHQTQPGIADELASFYAQHSGLVKTLGGTALLIALAKMKNHMSQT